MKVYELINLLSKYPAGNEVQLQLEGTGWVEITNLDDESDGETVILRGGDPMIYDEEANELDWLSAVISAYKPQ